MALKIAVLGGGPGGYVAALRAARLGAEVTLIERDRLGGVCLNRGCVPTKVMVTAAELLHRIRRAGDLGVEVSGSARCDMARLAARKESVVSQLRGAVSGLLSGAGVRVVWGEGRAAGPATVAVRPEGGEEVGVPFDRLIIATGSSPRALSGLPFDGVNVLSSDDAVNLAEVPESLVIVGGGVIGCEFACIFAAFGTRVTVVEALGRLLPLPAIEDDASALLLREMKKRGIEVRLSRTVAGVSGEPGALRVETAGAKGGSGGASGVVTASKVLVTVGRAPNHGALGLEAFGVRLDERGWIVADDHLAAGHPGVYVVGDALGPGKPMLAHAASAEGLTAAENACGGDARMNWEAIPWAVFTSPEVAGVGLTLEGARALGHHARAAACLFRATARAHVLGELPGYARVVFDETSGRVLGVHVAGAEATELIAAGVHAVGSHATIEDMAEAVQAHPTLSEALSEAAQAACGTPVHVLGR